MSTGISWTDETWNPVVGCEKVSQGCKNCYAKTLHDLRHKAYLAGKLQNIPQYAHPFETVQLMPDRLPKPHTWKKPRRVFVNSMSDLFHDDVPDAFIAEIFTVMAEEERHTFQILTKRPARMLRWFEEYLPEACSGEQPAPIWPLPNVWLGVSVENQAAADERIPLLLQTPAAIRFLSCEPLLGPLDLALWLEEEGFIDDRYCPPLDWVIVGGESGQKARETMLSSIESIVAQCELEGVACWIKQLGRHPFDDREIGTDAPLILKDDQGANMDEWPEPLRVRQWPTVPA